MLVFVLLSSVISVVVSWAAGGKGDPNDSIYPPQSAYTECGSLREDFFTDLDYWMHDKVRITLNEEWRDGVEVAIIGLGALANAIFVFIVISSEVQAQLLGVLRTLGLRDSVYWLSWYLVFVIVSVMNAILGAAMAKLLPGHVYESVFFLGIFASMLFLNLSLVSASIFLVALCGTSRQLCTNVCILSMIMAAFIPLIVQSLASSLPYGSDPNYFSPYPSGLFWQNSATTTTSNAYDFFDFSNGTNFTSLGSLCDVPIMNQDQGKWYKSELEARDVGNDEFFVGWYEMEAQCDKRWLHPHGPLTLTLSKLYEIILVV